MATLKSKGKKGRGGEGAADARGSERELKEARDTSRRKGRGGGEEKKRENEERTGRERKRREEKKKKRNMKEVDNDYRVGIGWKREQDEVRTKEREKTCPRMGVG